MEKYHVLVVEDDTEIANAIKIYLENQGYDVYVGNDGLEGLEIIEKETIHLAIVDIMMPRMDGLTMVSKLRERYDFPVIFLSAKSEDIDKIMGLNLGGDDYVTKPFNILEVKARMKAILRRNNSNKEKEAVKSNVLVVGDMKIDCDSRSLFIKGKEIYLTAKEFDLLELLAFNPNRVYSRDTLLKTVWGADYPGDGRTVDVHIRRLREKIEDNSSDPKYVHTKWGVGYYFNV